MDGALSEFAPIRRGRTLTDQTSEALRAAILTGELSPGVLYSVASLADRFDVSRTPLREALLRLADSGLVVVERNRGFRVVRADLQTVDDVFETRLLLEVPAAARAATGVIPAQLQDIYEAMDHLRSAAFVANHVDFMRLDRAFHRAVIVAAGNRVIVGIVDELRDTIATLGAFTAERSRSLREIAEEHVPIVDAIRRNDAGAAGAAMKAHLQHTHNLLRAQMNSTSS